MVDASNTRTQAPLSGVGMRFCSACCSGSGRTSELDFASPPVTRFAKLPAASSAEESTLPDNVLVFECLGL